MASVVEGIKTSRVSPRFLHGNATSHTWIFSAFAELIDNAYDPDVHASEMWIDSRNINSRDCITFIDNGNGMTPEKLFKMLSFGYCDKVPVGNVKPIGFYGNGFKSGSMRIGKDALVLTRCAESMSVGMLSQTYLTAIKAEAVVVPIVTYNLPSKLRHNTSESLSNMKAIMKHSLFQSEHELISELKLLERMETGTIIIIYNLNRDKRGNFEIDFESDKFDLRNPETHMVDLTTINRPIHQTSPEYKRSLREYCSILYLKPRMKIRIRGKKVACKLISKSLSKTEVDVYKPTWNPRPIKLTFGFTNSEETESYGLMMYHENRLIKAYEKIGCQNKANVHGIGVVGVVEANFLEPIHNKQDFNRNDKYISFMTNAAIKLNDYYFEKTASIDPDKQDAPQMSQLPDWTWVMCDNCLQWRRLPTGYTANLPDKWYCRMNPDAAFNRCDIAEEPEDDDEALQPTYRKTYKKSQEEKKRQAKLEEERKLKEKEEQLKLKEIRLQEKMKQVKKIAKQQEELAEVSSSQDKVDRKPTVADLMKAKASITSYQAQMKEKENTIRQLEEQQKEIEEKSKAMLRVAESLKISTNQGSSLLEKIQEIGGIDSTAVSSSSGTSSHGLRAPKRKQNSTDTTEEPGCKVIRIKTEDGGTIPVKIKDSVIDLTLDEEDLEDAEGTRDTADTDTVTEQETNDDNRTCETGNGDMDNIPDDNDQTAKDGDNEGKDKTSDKPTAQDEAKDKDVEKDMDSNMETDSESRRGDSVNKDRKSEKDKGSTKEGESSDSAGKSSETKTVSEDDTKPDKEELDKELTEMSKEADCAKTTVKKEFVESYCQTVPTIVKFASPEEVDLLKLSPVEQKETLLQKARELDETKKSMESLQENIWKLLKIIDPDSNFGEPENIERVILDFIKVNDEQEAQKTTEES